MSKLKPCPFRGGEPYIERMGTNRVSMKIECGDCGCGMETGETWIDENSSWNARTNDKLTNFLKHADSQDAFDSCALNGIAINAKALLDEMREE